MVRKFITFSTIGWDIMEIKDVRGKIIEIGSYIRYTGTGTIGKVADIKIEDEKDFAWVKIEDPLLCYSNDVVEVIDEKDVKTKFKGHKTFDTDDLKNIGDDLGDASLTSGGAEGGG